MAKTKNGHKLRLVFHIFNSRTLLFLVNENDLPEGLSSKAKPFADDTPILSMVLNSTSSLLSLFKRTYPKYRNGHANGRCYLNLDTSKHAQEIDFSRKKLLLTIQIYLPQYHAIKNLEAKLTFSKDINEKIKKQSMVLA